jgi:hypothetical protein
MLFAATTSSSSSGDDDVSEEDDDHDKKKKKKQQLQQNASHFISVWKTPHSSTKAFMRRAASVGDLLHVKKSSSSSSSSSKKKMNEHKKDTHNVQNAIIAILSALLVFSLLVIKQQNKNKKILEIDHKLHNTISALATRAQWSEVEMKGSNRRMIFNQKKKNKSNKQRMKIDTVDLLDEYGLPTLAAQCERKVEWPLLTSFVEEVAEGREVSICESFLDRLPKTLRVHTFPLSMRAQMRYNSLRKLPTFNRGYDVEDYLVRWLADGPFSINRKKTLTEKTEIAYLLPIQPYLDRVSSFPFSDGRERSESGVKSAVQYAKKVNPSLWEQSKGRRVIVTVHDFGTELATKIYPDDDDDDDMYASSSSSSSSSSSILSSTPSYSFSSSSSLVNTTHFIVSNSETDVGNAPFDARKDVAVVPSLSFFLPREAVSRGLVDLSHFMRDEEEYASFGLQQPKFDADRNIRLMFRGNNRGPLREKVFQYLVENGSEEDSIETTGVASPQAYMSLMEHSKYCLHVRGTRVMSPRLIELMLFGCVPVIVADAYELPLAWFLDWTKFSIRVPESDYKNIHAYIEQANWRELHANLGRVISFFVYHKSEPVVGDAFYATSLGLLNKLEHNNIFLFNPNGDVSR